MKLRKRFCLCIVTSVGLLAGCINSPWNPFPSNAGKIEGVVWCNQRYLDMVDDYQKIDYETKKKLALAKEGYVYALAATLTLQKNNSDKQFNFITPSYLEKIKELSKDNVGFFNGFAAESFIYSNQFTGEKELIVAFRGSDDFFKDYLFQNLAPFPVQNKYAREYVKEAIKYRERRAGFFGPKTVVVGNSLGGGLAAHVTNSEETANDITDAWVFNPSPRTGVLPPLGGNPKIRLLSTKSEALNISQRKGLGVQHQNEYTGFNLIKSSSIYNHYRWVLMREILWYADFAFYLDSDKKAKTTPPLEIIQAQNITSAQCGETNKITDARRKEYEEDVSSRIKKGSVDLKEVTEVDKKHL
ncbi:hypothetical protein SB719_14260 [Pantoea sp. SIMBA_079]|uniref:hypothetical protein n=3 Tax=Bacteria TaxID=2 RepID=UPI001111E7AA|nr:hypothetical protein [Pantoea eucrina]MDJ0022309.1 hypothetical protein [Pantoea eucrina]